MLYTNIDLLPENRGEIYGLFFLNKDKRGKDVFLPVNRKIKRIKRGFVHEDLTIRSRGGAPIIDLVEDENLYLFLATERRKSLRSYGILYALKDQKVNKIGDLYFRDSGSKSLNIVKAKEEDVFRISWGYSLYSLTTYYVVHNKNVFETNERENVKEVYKKIGLEIPFWYEDNEMSHKEIKISEWKTI